MTEVEPIIIEEVIETVPSIEVPASWLPTLEQLWDLILSSITNAIELGTSNLTYAIIIVVMTAAINSGLASLKIPMFRGVRIFAAFLITMMLSAIWLPLVEQLGITF